MAGLLVAHQAGATSVPSGLLCELLRQPERALITDSTPEFSWIVSSGEEQMAYQIQVAQTPHDLHNTNSLVWDSGRVKSSQSINIEYRGPVLASQKSYYWRVRIWGATAEQSHYSDAQNFRTGDLDDKHATVTLPLVESSIAPQRVEPTPAGGILVDFGRAAFGYLTIDVPAGWKTPLELRYGEGSTGGRVDMEAGENIRSGQSMVVPLGGDAGTLQRVPFQDYPRPGNAVPLPPGIGVILPYRYVEILNISDPKWADRLRMHVVHYPFDEKEAQFHSSDEILNAVWRLSKWTIKATSFAGVYVDGDRERIPYEADAYINQLGHYYTDREGAMARHSHEYLLDHPTWPTEWKFHSIFMAWADYMHTGNAESLAYNYRKLQLRLMLDRFDEGTGLLRSYPEQAPEKGNADLVDWPDGERDGFVFTEHNTVLNAFLYRSLVMMKEIALVVDQPVDARRYANFAAIMQGNFRRHFFDKSKGVFRDGVATEHVSFHANMFPLAFGLVDADDRAGVLSYLKSRGMQGSVYAAQYLLEALFDAGEAEAALALITAEGTDRSWRHMVDSGATITWEAWDMKYKPNLDWNHAWGAAPANILPRYVLGVRPLAPAFSRVLIAPQLGHMEKVAGRVPTIRGAVEVRVVRSSREVEIHVKRPGNMAAQFDYPLAQNQVSEVIVNGKKIRAVFSAGQLSLEDLPAGAVKILIRLKAPTGP